MSERNSSTRRRAYELPADYQEIIRDGIVALARVEAELTGRLALTDSHEDALKLREVNSLRGRLAEAEPDDWKEQRILATLSPLDVGLLEQLQLSCKSTPHEAALSTLARLLRVYLGVV